VPIRPFLDRDDAFGPEDIAPMSAAFETAIAKLIIEFAKVGERDPERLCTLALQQLSK
jgi:deoxyribose-phosphate aldolase